MISPGSGAIAERTGRRWLGVATLSRVRPYTQVSPDKAGGRRSVTPE